jgi:hypothetical protein
MLMTTKHYHTMYLGPVGFCLPALSVPPVFIKLFIFCWSYHIDASQVNTHLAGGPVPISLVANPTGIKQNYFIFYCTFIHKEMPHCPQILYFVNKRIMIFDQIV